MTEVGISSSSTFGSNTSHLPPDLSFSCKTLCLLHAKELLRRTKAPRKKSLITVSISNTNRSLQEKEMDDREKVTSTFDSSSKRDLKELTKNKSRKKSRVDDTSAKKKKLENFSTLNQIKSFNEPYNVNIFITKSWYGKLYGRSSEPSLLFIARDEQHNGVQVFQRYVEKCLNISYAFQIQITRDNFKFLEYSGYTINGVQRIPKSYKPIDDYINTSSTSSASEDDNQTEDESTKFTEN